MCLFLHVDFSSSSYRLWTRMTGPGLPLPPKLSRTRGQKRSWQNPPKVLFLHFDHFSEKSSRCCLFPMILVCEALNVVSRLLLPGGAQCVLMKTVLTKWLVEPQRRVLSHLWCHFMFHVSSWDEGCVNVCSSPWQRSNPAVAEQLARFHRLLLWNQSTHPNCLFSQYLITDVPSLTLSCPDRYWKWTRPSGKQWLTGYFSASPGFKVCGVFCCRFWVLAARQRILLPAV